MALTVTPAELTATALTLTTAAQPNITSVGTLTTLTVDDITINGSTISDAGEFTLDIGGDINIDADGGDINFKDGGTLFGQISNSSGLYLVSNVVDAPMYLRGNDGTSYVNALTIDFQNGGRVGIGDPTPQALLDVGGGYGGNTTVATFAHATDAYIEIENMTSQNGAGIILTNAGTKKWTIQKDTSAHSLHIQDTSSDVMTFLQGGNVGIGINPSNTFSVGASGTVTTRYTSTDTSAFSLLMFENSGSIVFSADHGNAAANSDIVFKADGATEKMRILSGGDVAFAANTTGAALIKGVSGNQTDRNTGGYPQYTFVGNEGTGMRRVSSNVLALDSGGAERVRIDSSGNVGINHTSPEHHLHVTEPASNEDGIVKIGGSNAGLGLELRYDQAGNTLTEIVANPTYTNVNSLMKLCVDGDANANQIVLTGAGTVSMGEFSTTDYRDGRLHTGLQGSGNDLRVTASGNAHVDISAVTSNSTYLTINSGESRLNTDAGYLAFGHNTNHSVPAFVAYIMHRSRGATNQGYFDFYTRNTSGTAIHTARMDGDASSGLYSRDGGVHSLSDGRLKKNIQDLTYSMEEFKALKPRTFEWINTGDHPEGIQNGFIAQELPELHKSNYVVGEKTGPLDEDIDPDYALVKDENGVGNAFGASLGSNDAMYVSIIQQLIARIEALENK